LAARRRGSSSASATLTKRAINPRGMVNSQSAGSSVPTFDTAPLGVRATADLATTGTRFVRRWP
jgi:hypothetical protein